MSKAEERANEAHPDIPLPHLGKDLVGKQDHLRRAYIEGYEQAEKDIINKAIKWLSEREWTNAVQLSMFHKYMEDEK